MRRKKAHDQEAPTTGDARITPEDVQKVEFRLAFRGYNERDVDAFLDRITEDLSSYIEESAQRSGGAPAVGPGATNAEADEIVANAREEAAAIVRRAEEHAASIRAVAGAGSGDARAAVAPFLNTEREFLQSLGSLVQTHAEEIKQMVMVLRERASAQQAPVDASPTEASAARPASEPPEAPDPRRPEPEALEPASAAEIRERLDATGTGATSDGGAPSGEPPEGPVVVESGTEPVYSTEGAPAAERRERSLRELFWGED